MPKKHLPPEHEILSLADEFARAWHPRHGVLPWLRSMEPELTRKVRFERWSWQAIALTLNQAGIRYASGRDWDADSLAKKIGRIRLERRTAADPQPSDTEAPTSPAGPAEAPRVALNAQPAPMAQPVTPPPSVFRPATLRSYAPDISPQAAPPKTPPIHRPTPEEGKATLAQFLKRFPPRGDTPNE